MIIEEINSCRICGNKDLIPVMDLGTHHLSGRFPGADETDPPKAPLALVRCNDSKNNANCGLLQLKHRVSPEELYLHDYGYRSGINRTMTEHLKGIVKEIEKKVDLKEGDIVLDIGSNDATLLKSYAHPNIIKIGIDPTGEQFKQFYPQNVKLVSDFFTKENFAKVSSTPAKAITSIAMFYDLQDPVAFAKDIRDCLAVDGVWVFEQSYMPTMLETKSFDTICHEHLEYYGVKQIDRILSMAGMRPVDITFNNSNGGSFRISAVRVESPIKPNNSIDIARQKEAQLRLESQEPYQDFVKQSEETRNKILEFVNNERNKGKTFHLCGASTKGNTLLQYFGLNNSNIVAAADRNPAKHGRRTPGTNIPIISETDARSQKPDYFFVLPWHFKEEIIERESEYLNAGGKLVFPLPDFEVVSNS